MHCHSSLAWPLKVELTFDLPRFDLHPARVQKNCFAVFIVLWFCAQTETRIVLCRCHGDRVLMARAVKYGHYLSGLLLNAGVSRPVPHLRRTN